MPCESVTCVVCNTDIPPGAQRYRVPAEGDGPDRWRHAGCVPPPESDSGSEI